MQEDVFNYAKELRAGFRKWNPIERATMLARGKKVGLSNRTLAKMVKIAEGSVRNLLSLLELPEEDQDIIACGGSYRPFLTKVKQIKEAKAAADASKTVAAVGEAAKNGVNVIWRLFNEVNFGSVYAEQALREVQAYIRGGEEQGVLKPSSLLWGNKVNEILATCRPQGLDLMRSVDHFNAVVVWMCNVLVRVMPNSQVRERAIQLALSHLTKLVA